MIPCWACRTTERRGKDGQTVDLRVPMEFKRRGGRKEIVLPPEARAAAEVRPRRPIVAPARPVLSLPKWAFKWQKILDAGELALTRIT